jgi:hopene-associated glycosyltransferase HpnB
VDWDAPLALWCALAAASALGWLWVLVDPAGGWRLRPVGEDEPSPPAPPAWPRVSALVPARDEGALLAETLPALLGQDYPGELEVVLVDDRSKDGTGELARALGGETPRLRVVPGAPLPRGWVGKVWALEQARRSASTSADYFLLTDADIRHAPSSLRRLVVESEAAGLGLDSRMARLRCRSLPERLLIPPFVFFFNLLYPMRRVNTPGSRVAAAAGGCVLLSRDVLERSGGFASISGEIIDDVALARQVKALGAPIRLAVSRGDVASLREYGSITAVWRMVRRTAFTELRCSWALLAGALAALALLFPLPVLCILGAIPLAAAGSAGWSAAIGALGLAAWILMAIAFRPATGLFGLHALWTLTLPLAGTLYGAMTLDSALRHRRGAPIW